MRVYLNVGSNAEPRFTDVFDYATDVRGERLKIDSW